MGDSGYCQEWTDVVEEYWGPIKTITTLPQALKLVEKVAGEVLTYLATPAQGIMGNIYTKFDRMV